MISATWYLGKNPSKGVCCHPNITFPQSGTVYSIPQADVLSEEPLPLCPDLHLIGHNPPISGFMLTICPDLGQSVASIHRAAPP